MIRWGRASEPILQNTCGKHTIYDTLICDEWCARRECWCDDYNLHHHKHSRKLCEYFTHNVDKTTEHHRQIMTCVHIQHTSSLSWYFTHSMRCGTNLQNVDISQTVSMQKQIMSTRPISGDHHQHILACFQCIQVSVSVGALKSVNLDRFLVIIISTDDLKLISFTMYLSDRCVHIYCLIITPVSDQLDITSRTLLHCRY